MSDTKTPWDERIAISKALSITTTYPITEVQLLEAKAEGYRVAKRENADLVEACKEILRRYAPGGRDEHCWICGLDHCHSTGCLYPQLQAVLAKHQPQVTALAEKEA